MARSLYLVCYDVSNAASLARTHKKVRAYAIGGQKSFYECWLTPAELRDLYRELAEIIDQRTDRAHFFQLDPRLQPIFIGQAKRRGAEPFLIV